MPPWASGDAWSRGLFANNQHPIQLLHVHVTAFGMLSLHPCRQDRAIFVLEGSIATQGRRLEAGSSIIVERNGSLEINAGEEGSSILLFFAPATPDPGKAGGDVHLLSTETVPRACDIHGREGLSGAIHALGDCDGCSVWLHENGFASPSPVGGLHSHEESEIIYVLEGTMLLGQRAYGPGTALFVAAGTLYGFGVGQDGLRFLNFRPARPGLVRTQDGHEMDEVAFWENLGRPSPVTFRSEPANRDE